MCNNYYSVDSLRTSGCIYASVNLTIIGWDDGVSPAPRLFGIKSLSGSEFAVSCDLVIDNTWARFLSLAPSKLRLCSANHRAGYFSNLACDWLSIVWAYSKQETENGPCFEKRTSYLITLTSGEEVLRSTMCSFEIPLSIKPSGTKCSEVLIEFLAFSLEKRHLKMSSANSWSYCFGLGVLRRLIYRSQVQAVGFLLGELKENREISRTQFMHEYCYRWRRRWGSGNINHWSSMPCTMASIHWYRV